MRSGKRKIPLRAWIRRKRMGKLRRSALVPFGSAVHKFVRSYQLQPIHPSNLTPFVGTGSALNPVSSLYEYFGNLVFSIKNLPDYTDFTALFDAYQIDWVKVVLRAAQNTVDASQQVYGPTGTPGQVNSIPLLTYAIDRDDPVLPTSSDQLLQYQNCRVRRVLGNTTIKLIPGFKDQVPAGGPTSVVVQNPRKGWIDMTNPDVPHYGVKFCWSQLFPAGSAAGQQVESYLLPTITIGFKCRTPR